MENIDFSYNLFHVECNKLGELGFTNNKVLSQYIYTLKA